MSEQGIFYKRLKEEIQLKGKTFNLVERELEYSRNALNNYKHGNEPSGTRLVELSEYLMVSPAYLVGKSNKSDAFSLKKLLRILVLPKKGSYTLFVKVGDVRAL